MNMAVIGCGYIGYSLIELFQNKYNIIGYDISQERINYLYNNHFYTNVIYTTDDILLQSCNIYIIAVSTDINNDKTINISQLLNIKNILTKYIKPNDVIILESSIYIGGTKELFSDLLKYNIFVGYSPERISPGDYEDSKNIPKIISGLNLDSLNIIYDIYSQIFNKLICVSSTETAELCKLYENCFRVINIAYVNEIADLSQLYNINFQEVMYASRSKPFGFMSFYPGFGIGGNCLPQNPYYLMHGLQDYKEQLPILYNSINFLNQRPLLKAKQFINFKKIIIIGLGFKPNQTLTILSPTLVLYNELKYYNKDVTIFDKLNFNLSLEYIKQFDCLIIGHQYHSLSDNTDIISYQLFNYGHVFLF